MTDVFHTILLTALPASGKSEIRNLLAHMPADVLRKQFHIGETLQLDDFPYVHMMRRIDQELQNLGEKPVYYPGNTPFYDSRDWGTLCHLLNEDYKDLLNRTFVKPDSAAEYLMERIDRAAQAVGLPPRNAMLKKEVRSAVAEKLEAEARKMLDEKHAAYPGSFEGKTIMIEFARGGPDGSSMPLNGAYGYQYTFAQLAPEILEHASVLYILVTPEESRRKNAERENPDDPGSNLFQGVPLSVMLGDYGCDDMQYLLDTSGKPGTVTVHAYGKTYYLPVGVFDNRIDRTSFLRGDASGWDPEKVKDVTDAVHSAFEQMLKNR